jgi:lipoprotein
MKKLSIAVSTMACAALVLSGCGNSVSDDRAQAYASLSSMSSLSTSQAQEYKQRLTVAPDSAAIKSVLAEAKAANDKEATRKASVDKELKDTEVAITGVKLVGTTGACVDVILVFNADKTWQTSGNNSQNPCIPHDYKYWGISKYTDSDAHYLVFRNDKDTNLNSNSNGISYPIRVGSDGTVTIEVYGKEKFTITK